MNLWLFLPLGLAIGAFGTLIGAGGGFILVPILLLLYPNESRETLTAISLATIFLNALSGSIAYGRMKKIDYRAGIVFALASIPGAILGASTTAFLSKRVFDAILGSCLIAVSAYLLIRVRPRRLGGTFSDRKGGQAAATKTEHRPNLWLGGALSALVGYVSSILGIGGGIIHVPALVFLLGFPAHVATATSHFVLAWMTLFGAGTHVISGDLTGHWAMTGMIGAGVVVGAQVGARASRRVNPRWIIRFLAVALIFVGLRVIWQSLEESNDGIKHQVDQRAEFQGDGPRP